MVRSLKGWLSGLKEKKTALLEALRTTLAPDGHRGVMTADWLEADGR